MGLNESTIHHASTRARPASKLTRVVIGHLLRYALLLPPLGVVATFVVAPMVRTIISSFDSLNARGVATGYAGIQNYQTLFHSSLFHQVLLNTLIYSVAATMLSIAIAFGLSLLLISRVESSSRFLLVGLFSPTIMPMIAAANIWLYFLTPRFGLVDRMLSWLGLGHENWLGHPGTALTVLVLLFVWKYAPYFTLFLLAGFSAIPPDVREAMRTEDPSGWYSFRKVILPILSPMLAFVTTMAVLYSLETVDPVYVLTQGGPNNGTNLVMFYLFQLGFNYFSWGSAAALSTLLLVSLSTLSGLSLVVMERRAFHWQ